MMIQCTWYVMHSIGFENRYYFKRIVYQGSTEQDAVVSSLMAIIKKILNGSSFKHLYETVVPTSRVALSKSIHILTTNSVKYSRGADSSYEQSYCDFGTPLSLVCGIQAPCSITGQHATGQCSFSTQ